MTNIPSNPKPQFEEKKKEDIEKVPPKIDKDKVKKELLKIIADNRKIEEKIEPILTPR